MSDHLKNLSQVYLEQIAESAVPGKPAEKLGAVTGIPKADQMSAAERIKKKTAEKKAALEKKHGKKMDDHPEYPNKKYVDEENVDEAMSSYDRNRKRAAQRAAERNAARAAGKTGVVPGVGYVSPRKERETYVDSAGTTRHKSGAKMEEVELDENRRAARAAGGYKDDSKKQTDPSKAGFTGISGSIKDIMRQNKEIEARNKAKSKTEALDPVGKEDGDVDNDGKKTTSDKYIMKRREAIRKAIAAKKKVSEQLGEELVIEVSGEEKDGKIKEKKVNNKITINPELKESISEIGGEVLFISEVDEVDSIAESVHIELIEEGYSEDQVVEAIKYAIDEVTNPAKVAAFKMKKAKYTPKPETKEEPKKSLKDRIKSVAKKALDKASETAGKIMKKKAEIQAAPAKAKKKLGSYVDRAKAVAKSGYERGRGPVEKKPTTYRGAGAGRKEKIGEEVATDPKMQQLQKKQIMLDRQKLAARVQAMQKKKPAPEQAQEELSVDQQMKISQKYNRMTPEQRKAANKKVMGNVPKVAPKKDTRTDAQKMTDAVGKPRMGSSD